MRRILTAATAVLTLAAAAGATIVLRASPRELADHATLVVEGRVASVDVRWDDDRTIINHYVTFQVEDTLKGKAPGSLVITVPGGKVDDDEVLVEGMAEFAEGERAVVFLWQDGRGQWQVLGEAQGKFTLYSDEKQTELMAANSLKGLCLVVRGDPKSAAARRAHRPDVLPHADLVAVVRDAVKAAADRPAGGSGGATTGGSTTGGDGGDAPDATGDDPAADPTTDDDATPTTPPAVIGSILEVLDEGRRVRLTLLPTATAPAPGDLLTLLDAGDTVAAVVRVTAVTDAGVEADVIERNGESTLGAGLRVRPRD